MIKTKGESQSCKLEQSDRDGLILVSHYQVQEDTRFSHQVLKNAERNIRFPHCQVQEKTHYLHNDIGQSNILFLSRTINNKGMHTRFPLRTNECKKTKNHTEKYLF